MSRRHYAFAQLTDVECAVVKTAARTAGLTMSDFVRRCINSYLLEGGDEVPLLAEKAYTPRRSTGNVSDKVSDVAVSQT